MLQPIIPSTRATYNESESRTYKIFGVISKSLAKS